MKECHLQQHGRTQRLSYGVKSDREGEISCNIPCMWNLKRNDIMNLYLQKRKRLTDIENELIVAGGKDGGKGQRVRNGNVHTVIFKMDNQQTPTIQNMKLCTKLCSSLDGRGVWGRMDTCMCMAESLCCSPETITTLIGFTQTQN